jgi:hypothetical protein
MDILYARERRRDDLAHAKKQRLVRLALSSRPSLSARYQRWLARVGTRLVAWGHRLEARYADALAISSAVHQECSGIEGKTSPMAS